MKDMKGRYYSLSTEGEKAGRKADFQIDQPWYFQNPYFLPLLNP
jgi:hypothetical protein